MYFCKQRLPKTWLVKCQKSHFSTHPLTVTMLNSPKNCTEALLSYFFITLAKIKLENVRLSVSKILGVFVNTLTAGSKHALTRKNLAQPIQLLLSKKRKISSHLFAANLESRSNFEHFGKKDYPHRLCIFEIRDCERRGQLNV